MRNQQRTPRTPMRMLASFLTWLLVAGQVLQPVYAVLTPLGDVPAASKVAAKPNIVYTLDDSGSMQYNYLPDFVVNAGATLPLTNITRAAAVATATGSAANIATLSVGDFVTIAGANPPEFNGYFQITGKTATTFTYTLTVIPVAVTTTVAAGYTTRQLVTSAAYCRSGSATTTCPQQAVNIATTGTAVAITGITRAPVSPAVGPATATATGTLANFQQLSTGDTVTIAGATGTSAPFNGVYSITKTSATTFTYTMNALATTPTSAAGAKTYMLSGGSAFAPPPLHTADFNHLAYNPNVTYTAPVKADGTPVTNTGTDANGNYGTTSTFWNTASVDRDPYSAYETAAGVTPMWSAGTKDNMSLKMAVPLYCNTDWPLLVNDAYWPGGPNGATALDAGTTNGQYSAGTGGWCRINGTKYDLSAASGAPAAADDYNYPWQSSSGATGAQYFYRQLGTKTLWCDNTSPYWPKTQGALIGCTGGVFKPPVTEPQFCKHSSFSNTCTGSYPALTYKDTATSTTFCDASATWCSPPGTGSSPECKACTCVPNTPKDNGVCRLTSTGVGGSGAGCSCTGAGCVLPACPNFTVTAATCTGGTPVYTWTAAGSIACNSQLWDPIAGAPSATTALADAGAPGTVGAPGTTCRHNNYTYAVGGAAGLFKYSASAPAYPGEGAGTAHKFNQAATSGCPAVGTTVQIPRHYYVVDSVQFCNDRIVAADTQWKGFGTGACQDKNDLSFFKDVKYGKFTRVDVFPGNTVLFPGNSNLAASATPYPNGRVWLAGATPGPDNSESINYANWYAYYSTRLNAAKSTSAIGFSFLTSGVGDPIAYRVGFHNLGEEPAGYGGAGTPIIWADVKDWDLAQRTAWYGKLFGISVSTYKTPTIDAMLRIGNLFETGTSAGLPAEVNPLPAAAADPLSKDSSNNTISCQNNYHILFTDGKTNQVSLPNITPAPTDLDSTIPTFLTTVPPIPPDQVLPTLSLGGSWPAPFLQGSPAVSNTLADVAARYWANDLRPALKNDVPASSGKQGADYCPLGNTCPPDPLVTPPAGDVDPTKDVAWWQHVNFSAISFGAEGTLDPSNQPVTLADIQAGSQSWPNLTQPNNPIYPRGAGAGAVAVDDLWRATLMARGAFVYAKSPVEVSYGISSILAGIQNQRKSRAGAAFNSNVLDQYNNIIFEPVIEPGWAGDLLKVEIDPATGAEVATWWQAKNTLAAQIKPSAGNPEPWMKPANRRIVTLAKPLGAGNAIAGPGIAFQYTDLFGSAVGKTMLNAIAPSTNITQQQKMISYLRGGNTFNNGATVIEGTGIGQFRKRFGPLGDLSNASPVIVGPPQRTYVDTTDPGYSNYMSTKAARGTVVVAAANDGMVHVFDAGPMPSAGPPPVAVAAGGGTEVFAYIPRALFRGVAGSLATEDITGIQALSYQDGGIPIYHHHMYVDATPRAADVDFNNGVGAPDWHTIVVGGLGKGGNSYYALDLTDASLGTVPDETAAANRVLWEFFNPDADVGPGQRLVAGGSPGFSYTRPVIVKVREPGYPTGRWVVIVTGGYNNVSGRGKLFFLDAKTGQVLVTLTMPAGSTAATTGSIANPQGFAQIHGFVRNQNDQTIEQIYGGDLMGNVYRVDVSARSNPMAAPDYAANIYNGAGATAPTMVLFAELTDPPPTSAVQPVTTQPQIEIDLNNGIDRYVFFGTGRLLHPDDLSNPPTPQQQTYYAIRDGTLQAVQTAGLPIQPRATMVSVPYGQTAPIVGGAPNGWYEDMPNNPADPILGAQRIVVDPVSQVNIAAWIGTKIQDDPCQLSLPAYLYARDYTAAGSLLESGGALVPSFWNQDASGGDLGGAGLQLVGRVQADGSLSLGALVSGEVPGTTPFDIKNPVTGPGLRWSWRLLTGE